MENKSILEEPTVQVGIIGGVLLLVDKFFLNSKYSKQVVGRLADRLEEFCDAQEKKEGETDL